MSIRAKLAEGWRNVREAFAETDLYPGAKFAHRIAAEETDYQIRLAELHAREANMAATTNRERTRLAERYELPLDPIAGYYGGQVYAAGREAGTIATPAIDDAQRRYEAGLAPYDDAEMALHAHWDAERFNGSYQPIAEPYTGTDLRLMPDEQLLDMAELEVAEVQRDMDAIQAHRQARWADIDQVSYPGREDEYDPRQDDREVYRDENDKVAYQGPPAEPWGGFTSEQEADWENTEPVTGQREAEFLSAHFIDKAHEEAIIMNDDLDRAEKELDRLAAEVRALCPDPDSGRQLPAEVQPSFDRIRALSPEEFAAECAAAEAAYKPGEMSPSAFRDWLDNGAVDEPDIDGPSDEHEERRAWDAAMPEIHSEALRENARRDPRLDSFGPDYDQDYAMATLHSHAFDAPGSVDASASWDEPLPEPAASEAEMAAISAEFIPGQRSPDPYSKADMAAWRLSRGGYEAGQDAADYEAEAL